MVSFLYTSRHQMSTRVIPTSPIQEYVYNCNTNCDPWLPKVKPAALNPLDSQTGTFHSQKDAALLSHHGDKHFSIQ